MKRGAIYRACNRVVNELLRKTERSGMASRFASQGFNPAVRRSVLPISETSLIVETLESRQMLSATPVNLSSSFNKAGIVTDFSTFTGGIDGSGTALSANLLGTSQSWGGNAFNIGAAGSANVVSGNGQIVSLPAGAFGQLNMLALHVSGSATNLSFVVTYTDGSTQNFSQSVSDWYSPQSYAGESTAITMAHRDLSGGTEDNRTFRAYGYSFALDNSKGVSSITLPKDSRFNLLAMDEANPLQVPSAPSATAVAGGTQVSLTWPAVSTATGYKVYYGTSSGSYGTTFVVGAATSFTVTNLTAGIPYYFAVSAYNYAGDGAKSAQVTSTPLINVPTAPTLLSTIASDGHVALTWTSPPLASGYKVYVGTSSRTYGSPINVGNASSYSVTGLTNGTMYYFTISAYDSTGEGSRSNELYDEPQSGTQQLSLSASFNRTGIFADGTSSATSGIDGSGAALSATQLGRNLTSASGADFQLPDAGGNNVISSVFQTLQFPQTSAYLNVQFLGLKVHGSSASEPLIVTYMDGTIQTFNQGFSDWATPASYTGESIAATMSYRDTQTGGTASGSYHVYAYNLSLSKPAQSLTLPADGNLEILAMDLSGATTLPTSIIPPAPYDVQAHSLGGTDIQLTWGDLPVATTSGFTISAKINGAAWTAIGTAAPNVTSYLATDLPASSSIQLEITENSASNASSPTVQSNTAIQTATSSGDGLYLVTLPSTINFQQGDGRDTPVGSLSIVSAAGNSILINASSPGDAAFKALTGSMTDQASGIQYNFPASGSFQYNPAFSVNGSAIGQAITATDHYDQPGKTYDYSNDYVAISVIAASPLPGGWSDGDIGSPAIPGGAMFDGAAWTVGGGGADIAGASDQFNFASQSVTGSTSITAQLTGQALFTAATKSGLMFRDNSSATAAFADVVLLPQTNSVAFMCARLTALQPVPAPPSVLEQIHI